MRVLVLEGGDSPEREISLRSAQAVVQALQQLGHQVERYDPAHGLDGLKNYQHVDVTLPILHGPGGEDGTVQTRLEALGMPFLGSGSEASRLCMDKHATKQAIAQLGYNVPAGHVVDAQSMANASTDAPFVLKPLDSGSSVDTYIVRQPQATQLDFEDIFSRHATMLLEELIDGTEITVTVLGGVALPVIEIIPPVGEEFDYDNKYSGRTQELCPPQHVTQSTQQHAQTMAEHIHRGLNLRHLSRTDMIVTDDELYVLEVNTIPGLTEVSLVPLAAQTAGMTMDQLIQRLVDLAVE